MSAQSNGRRDRQQGPGAARPAAHRATGSRATASPDRPYGQPTYGQHAQDQGQPGYGQPGSGYRNPGPGYGDRPAPGNGQPGQGYGVPRAQATAGRRIHRLAAVSRKPGPAGTRTRRPALAPSSVPARTVALRLGVTTTAREPDHGVDLARAEAAVRECCSPSARTPTGGPDTHAGPGRAGIRRDFRWPVRRSRLRCSGRRFDEDHDELGSGPRTSRCIRCASTICCRGTGRRQSAISRARTVGSPGLSKLARLVDLYARAAPGQERLTSQVADALRRRLEPQGVIVVIQAEHLCMAMRGIRKPGSLTVTSAVRRHLPERPPDPRRGADAVWPLGR